MPQEAIFLKYAEFKQRLLNHPAIFLSPSGHVVIGRLVGWPLHDMAKWHGNPNQWTGLITFG